MPDLVHIDGKPFVLVPMHDYRRLVNGTNVAESNLPDDLLDQIAMGQSHPIKIIRKFRGMTQHDLAAAAGLSRPYLTEIETGKKEGSISALRLLASALGVSIDLVIPALT
jgi:DNA-binding XRE family transcriptional regulator